jgi:prepilin peptidase CpaA
MLWMVGTAGGGDVKLLAGLSVWLGAGLTLKVILVRLIFVVISSFGIVAFGFLRRGRKSTSEQHTNGEDPQAETVPQQSKRRVMAFAMPVALATWSVLLLFQNQW